MPKKIKILIYLLVNILFTSSIYSQYSKNLILIERQINSGKSPIALQNLKKVDTILLSSKNKAFYKHLLGQCYSYGYNNRGHWALKYYLEAKKQYLKIDSTDKAISINLDIAHLLGSSPVKNDESKKYLDEYFSYANNQNNSLMLAKGYISAAVDKINPEDYKTGLDFLKKAIQINKNIDDKKIASEINNNLALFYNEYLEKPDSALYCLKKDLSYLRTINNQEYICYNYINQAASYYYLKDYKKAIEYLKMADKLNIKEALKIKLTIYDLLSINYGELRDYKNAYEYLYLNQIYNDSLDEQKQSIAIIDFENKYQTAEKELENTELKSNIKTNRILLYTFTSLLIASLIIAFLVYKNAKRREKISLQEKLIEQQKLEKVLKDYELNSIDLMLEGQEKERQRIANDLHDNLGSMLATLKLNFENLRLRKNELKDEENKLYERTDELIEEAYQKVRRLAHAKNAGVFASQGLIPAIKKLAEKISIPGKLQIEVIPFGFNDRLENTLEIAIFRAVQELSTNIIKHSEATEATIHLTNHEDNINIIIEDNGVGFDSKKISTADGMGLQTIQKKIIQLGGTFTIDTTPGKGTTIIIDIPV